ncbi:Hsp20/alpha crystallin family protein [Bacillaceae bacterium S4-13-58]
MFDPFKNMDDWQKNMDTIFGKRFWNQFEHFTNNTFPKINMYQTDQEILCMVYIPGVRKVEDINVYADETTLELEGSIRLQTSHHKAVLEEIPQGDFHRKVDLPFPVRSDRMEATYENGLLVIQLYRLHSKDRKKKRVEVKYLDEE